jgi:hypothetical protein
MVPLYAARTRDLGPGDFVHAKCGTCGHDMLIPAVALTRGSGSALKRIADLARPGCDVASAIRKDRAVVLVKWHEI